MNVEADYPFKELLGSDVDGEIGPVARQVNLEDYRGLL